MSRSASPLRYPGGKACLLKLAVTFLSKNELTERNYIEPYSGGCGLALNLLFNGHVSRIHLNDLDRSVWAFWTSIIDHTSVFIDLVNSTPVTIDQWEHQRSIQVRKADADIVELGFSTFFLNRTNRSGIIHSGGVIGGKMQSGEWKIDCRYNKVDLINRIQRVVSYKNRMNFYNMDAEDFINSLPKNVPSSSIIYIDPPYYEKGSQLYKNAYRPTDHERIAQTLTNLEYPWFLTYDDVQAIRELYSNYNSVSLDIGYSIRTKRRGSEIFVVSKGLHLPENELAVAH